MIKVSVIIAVYNAEAYLERCLDSLIHQTLEEIEIIAVNDGSTDRSQEILEKYKMQSNKLLCVQKENGGAAEARNYGLNYANGEYIGYVDSDDFVDLNMFEELYQKAVEGNYDIVECNLRHTYESKEDIEIMKQYYDPKELLMFGRYVVWNKIYNREWLLASHARFPAHLIYEDVEFIARLVPYIKRYAYVDIAPVHYVQRISSVNNQTSNKTLHILEILQNILCFYKEQEFYEEYKNELEYFFIRILLCSSLARMCRMENRKYRMEALKSNWKLLLDTFPNWRQNPVLRKQKTMRDIFMKLVNKDTYYMYAAILTLNVRMKRTWRRLVEVK